MSLYLGNNLISGVATPIEGARNIGQIITSTIPLSDAGLHLLDGALISGSGSYADFVTYIAGLVSDYPDLFETEANWQTSVTNYGVCGKFVYDSVNNTVRLPKITGFIEGTTDASALGDLIEAGCPNITGSSTYNADTYGLLGSEAYTEGAFNIGSTSRVYSWGGAAGANAGRDLLFDASRSSSVYGNSTTVQPQAIKVLYYIVIATSVKTQIEVDIDEIATDLNGKADVDLANCTKPHIVETYSNGTSWYRIYSDGWCEQGGQINHYSSNQRITVNFLKTMADTNYSIQRDVISTYTSGTTDYYWHGFYSISTTGFECGVAGDANTYYKWYVCGYIS